MIAQPISVNNNKFNSLTEACKHYNLHYYKVINRLNRGWSVNEAFNIKKRKINKIKGKVYIITNSINNKVYIGVTRNTLKERFNQHKNTNSKLGKVIKKYGITKFKIKLLKSCSTVEELSYLEKKYINKYQSIRTGYNVSTASYNIADRKSIYYEGKYYTVRYLMDKYSLSYQTVVRRIKNKKLLTDNTGKRQFIYYEGYKYSLKDLANKLKLPVDCLRQRIKNNTPLDSKLKVLNRDSILYKNKYYTKTSLAKKLGLKNSTLLARIAKNIQLDKKVYHGCIIKYKGKTFNKKSDLAKSVGLSLSALKYRIKNGLNLETPTRKYNKNNKVIMVKC